MRVCVIGGGYTGLAAAVTLAQKGIAVDLAEASTHAGGLAASFDLAGTRLDYNYRHIFRTDSEALNWIKRYSLELNWYDSRMGYFSGGKIYPFGRPQDLLTFSPLSWFGRFRFGIGTLLIRGKRDYHDLENLTAEDYIVRTSGREAFETIWKPLLVAKFGDDYAKVSAVWFWGKIALRSRSRDSSGLNEQLGYMPGSFSVLTDAMIREMHERKSTLMLETKTESIDRDESGHFTVQFLKKSGERFQREYTHVLSCVPLPVFVNLARDLSEAEKTRWQAIRYTAATVLIIQMRKAFSNFYWMNIGDRSLPFGGLIEHTNLVPTSWYGGRHILYVSHYVFQNSQFYRRTPDELLGMYLPYLKKVNPHFCEKDILEVRGGTGDFAQPIVEPGYAARKPGYATTIPNLFHAGMAHIYPEDRGINYALRGGREAAELVAASTM